MSFVRVAQTLRPAVGRKISPKGHDIIAEFAPNQGKTWWCATAKTSAT